MRKPKKRSRRALENWEISLVKAMILSGKWPNDQDILAFFTRPTRSVNHRVISEIRTNGKHASVKAASTEVLEEFLATWPNVDPKTGLSIRGDELIIKAREAMIAAVHIFNSAGLVFRSELFIVTAIIGWTYLLHSWFRREGIDYRYKEQDGSIKKTKQGEDCYWDLSKSLKHERSPVSAGAAHNLEFLLAIRHEIEHRATNRIDDAISAKLQACCINFNDLLKQCFGTQYGLERQLPIALQFVTFSSEQRAILKRASTLPPHIESEMNEFHNRLTEAEQADPSFAYRIAFVPKVGNRASSSDLAIEFVRADSEEGTEINRVLMKEVNKKRYTSTHIVNTMKAEGFNKFNIAHHTELWKSLDAKDPKKQFGCAGDYKKTWVWFDSWMARVRAHCQEHENKYE